jgi:hypothetical protein
MWVCMHSYHANLVKRSVYDAENAVVDKCMLSQSNLGFSKTTAFGDTKESQSMFLY